MNHIVFTIGHSNHTQERFIELLTQHGITALCDVRSHPYSRIHPQFKRHALKQALQENNITYVFLGKELGARSEDPACYIDGKVQYDLLAKTELFQKGLARVQEGMRSHRIALMCAEKDPLYCHRTILVARHLVKRGVAVEHIRDDGRLENHTEVVVRLMRELKLSGHDMFQSGEELVEEAYRLQGERMG